MFKYRRGDKVDEVLAELIVGKNVGDLWASRYMAQRSPRLSHQTRIKMYNATQTFSRDEKKQPLHRSDFWPKV